MRNPTVKFNWNLRKRPAAARVPDTKTCRTTAYMQRIKNSNPEAYKKLKKKDTARKQKEYIPIWALSEIEKKNQRDKWAECKRELRAKRKRQSDTEVDEHPKQRFKDLNAEERKAYFKQKMAESRSNTSKQKKTQQKKKKRIQKQNVPISSPTHANDEHLEEDTHLQSTSKSEYYRIRQSVMEQMPKTPRSYDKLHRALAEEIPGKKEVKRSFAYEGMKKKFEVIMKKATNKNRTFVYQLAKCVGWRFGRKYLGLSWKTCIASKNGKTEQKKNVKGKVISPATQQLVQEFWWSAEVSRQMPLKKKVKKNQAAFLLEVNYTQAYRKFKAAHPSVKIGYVKFIQLKPSNVKRMKALKRVVCCCQRCENVKLKVKALNSAVSSNECRDLRIDAANLTVISGITLCHDDNRIRPKAKCLDQKCTSCSEKNITTHYAAFLRDNKELKLKYELWSRVKKTKTVKGTEKEFTVTELLTKEATVGELIQDLELSLKDLSAHLKACS